MASVNPYLGFDGNCEEAFDFYKSVFGNEFAFITRYKDMPAGTPEPHVAADAEKIMHVSLPIGHGTVIMGSDRPSAMGPGVKGGSFQVSINADSEEEADHLYKSLSEGGSIFMPLSKTFWGAYFGMFTDKFGVHWMVSYTYPQQH